jgi:serine/threonine protein phosphatase PrpC
LDAHLFLATNLPGPVLIPAGGGTAVVYTHASPRRAPEQANQDAVAVFDLGNDAVVLAVADGVGGHNRGDEAARITLEILTEQLRDVDVEHADLRESIMTAIERANAKLIARNPSPATTIVVATILHGQLRCYTVGDSELMIVGQRGRLKLRTIPHSPTGYGREAGLLDEAGAMLHGERHVLSNVIGMQGMHVAATSTTMLSSRDTVVLGSDGVFDNLYHDEIIELVRAGEPLTVAERLLERLRERMAGPSPNPEIPNKPDDLSFVLYRPLPPSTATRNRAERTAKPDS